MCLSTAYKNKKDADNILCKNVTRVTLEDGAVVLTDLMDEEIRIEGTLKVADLVNGYVIIDTAEAA